MGSPNQGASRARRRRQDCEYTPFNWSYIRRSHVAVSGRICIDLSQRFKTANSLDCKVANSSCNREDGSIDHSSTAPRAPNATAAHKLGPKANQGAINAGLRALDRSGKPCRKWQKGSFTLKSFTGVVWEIPRWTAPPKIRTEGTSGDSASGDSSKENKDNSQLASEKSEKSNGGADIELGSTASNNASSPAPSTLPPSSAPAAPAIAASA